MKNKHLLNGLMISLMLTAISAQAQPAWISAIEQYFNKPTQTALVVTTAIAGVSALATAVCAWNWWQKSKQESLLDTAHKKNYKLKQTTPRISIRSKESLKKQIARKDKQLKSYARKTSLLESRLISMAALVVAARQEHDHSCSQNCEHESLELMKKTILDLDQGYQTPPTAEDEVSDGTQNSSSDCPLTAPIVRAETA